MDTLTLINGYNEAAKVLGQAKIDAVHDAQAIYSQVYRIDEYINGQIMALLAELKG